MIKGKSNRSLVSRDTRSESEVREDLGLSWLGSGFKTFGNVLLVFLIFAGVGAVMNAASNSGNKVIVSSVGKHKDVNVGQAKEALLLAADASFLAAKLWGQLIMSIILPTSHQTFVLTKDGMTAMQPSIRASWMFIVNSHWTTKIAIVSGSSLVVIAWILQREIKKRRYVQRTQHWYNSKMNVVHAKYDILIRKVRKTSSFLADLIPHLLFVAGVMTALKFAKAQFSMFAHGLGGFSVVIGLPVLLSVRALIVYDIAYRARIEALEGKRKRTFSHFPTPENVLEKESPGITGWVKSWVTPTKARADSLKDEDVQSVCSLDSSDSIIHESGISYPKRLEDDLEGCIEQYEELRSVLYWVQYWTVIGLIIAIEQLPITGQLLNFLWFWPVLGLVVSLWLQVPGTSGAYLCFTYIITPFVDRFIGSVETPEVSEEQSNLILNVLFAFRLINMKQKSKLGDVFASGGTVIFVAFPFFFLPSIFTQAGCVLIGFGRPMLSGVRTVITANRARALTAKQLKKGDKTKKSSPSIPNTAVVATQWLEYWVIYAAVMFVWGFWTLFLYWFPFWYHMQLIGTLWLQLPYFRGAHTIFKYVLEVYYIVYDKLFGEKVDPLRKLSMISMSADKRDSLNAGKKKSKNEEELISPKKSESLDIIEEDQNTDEDEELDEEEKMKIILLEAEIEQHNKAIAKAERDLLDEETKVSDDEIIETNSEDNDRHSDSGKKRKKKKGKKSSRRTSGAVETPPPAVKKGWF